MTRSRDKANITQRITASEPVVLTDGMVWLDTDAVSTGQQNLRWTKSPGAGTTTLTGTDDNSITLTYTAGQETVFANGVLLIRGSDYTASNGTSVVLASGSVAGDVFEVISVIPLNLVDTYTQTQADGKFVNNTLADAKGDLFVGTADNVISKLTVGNNGQSLVADSTATAGVRWQDNIVAGKNAVINGGMDIWQRGTSKLDGANNYHTADRWLLSSAPAVTFSRQLTSDTTNLPHIQYCMRLQRTAGSTSTNNMNIAQSFESVNSAPLAGKTVTLSFYSRKGANYSSTNSDISVQLFTGTGTDQNVYTAGYTGSVAAINSTAILTTTWQRFTFTGTLATNTNEIGLIFVGPPTGTAGANDYYEITGVQLEIGSVATHFSRAGGSIGGELALCQRYYYRQTATQNFSAFGYGTASSTTGGVLYVALPQTMRVEPSAADYSTLALTDQVAGYTFSGLGFGNQNGRNIAQLTISGATGLTQYRTYFLGANGSSSAFVGLSAEL